MRWIVIASVIRFAPRGECGCAIGHQYGLVGPFTIVWYCRY